MRSYISILDLRVVDFPIISFSIYKSVRQRHYLLIRFLQFSGVSRAFEIYSFSSLSLRSFHLLFFSILISYSYFDSLSSVTISLRYKITLAFRSLPSTLCSSSFLLPESRRLLYQLWNLKSPEGLYAFGNPYSTGEKWAREFLSREIVLHIFSLALSVSRSGPTLRVTLRAQRRKCVVKYLTWSIPSPPLPNRANPFYPASRSFASPLPLAR